MTNMVYVVRSALVVWQISELLLIYKFYSDMGILTIDRAVWKVQEMFTIRGPFYWHVWTLIQA